MIFFGGIEENMITQEMDNKSKETSQEVADCSNSQTNSSEQEKKARVDAMWEQMNKGVPAKTLKTLQDKTSLPANKSSPKEKASHGWMNFLGMTSKRKESSDLTILEKKPPALHNGIDEGAKKLAAAALAAVKDSSVFSTASSQGKVEITEVRDFAGKDIEVKKIVDANSREAAEKSNPSAGPSSAVDSVLEQIKKKQKLSVLDKTKKDWGEFKEDNKGVEEELDAYKKSSNQYLGKVSFLERADYREFERERDARLSLQSKRRPDMRDD
ncbi:hypothetical protein V2J09_022887 [Rumex salicifolius]